VSPTKREETLALPGIRDFVINSTSDSNVTVEYLGSVQPYPLLAGLRPDLYRCFMEQTWEHSSKRGVVTLIHPETHFTDERAVLLREHTYRRLRRHWQFINELMFYEIDHKRTYGIHVYARSQADINFLMASSLYHPDMVERSLRHDGSGEEPGFKDPNGNWDLRPHRKRIVNVVDETLGTWHAIMESDSLPVSQTRMVYTVNSSAEDVLKTVSRQPRFGALGLQFSPGWNETRDRKKGYFELRWGLPRSWEEVIIQGPHIHVGTPNYKSPNESMRNNQDWSLIDLEALAIDDIPVTTYKPAGSRVRYDADYTQWDDVPARARYRIAWRRMAANTGERTLIPAIIPPGAAHVDAVISGGFPGGGESKICVLSGFLGSLIADFFIRSAPKGDIRPTAISRLPVVIDHPLYPLLALRALRINCLSGAYADLWLNSYQVAFGRDEWASGYARHNHYSIGEVAPSWSADTPLRIAEDRRQALLEIDALVALMLGVTADQICAIYRTQFAVLYGYDHRSYVYDANGRLVPSEVLSVWRRKGDAITAAERTATNQAGHTYIYELPFRILDREADMRTAYAEFERRLAAL
jgi:hypothetical protein